MKIDSDLKALFRGNNQTVKDLLELEGRIGSYSEIMVVSQSSDFEKNLKFFSDFKDKIEGSKLVRFVEMDNDIDYLEKRALLFLKTEDLETVYKKITDKIREVISDDTSLADNKSLEKNENRKNTESEINKEMDSIISKIDSEKRKYNISRYFVAEDGKYMAIKVRPMAGETDIEKTKEIIQYLNNVKDSMNPDSYGVYVEVGGNFQNKLKETEAVMKDVVSTLGLCILLLSLTMIFYFRSFFAFLMVVLSLSFGVSAGIVLSLMIVGKFNIISAFSFVMLYGLGIDFAIHLITRYAEEKESCEDSVSALKNTYISIIPSVFSGAITTALAFFSLAIIEFKGFSEFGVVAGVGVMVSFLLIVLSVPSFILFLEKFVKMKIHPVKINIFRNIFMLLNKRRALSMAFFIILTGVALVLSFTIHFEYGMDNISFPHKNNPDALVYKYRAAMAKEKKDQMSDTLHAYVLTDSLEETKDVKQAVEKLIADQNKYPIKTERIMSIYNFVPDDQDKKLQIIRKIARLIKNKKNLFDEETIQKFDSKILPLLDIPGKIEMDKLPAWILDKFKEQDGSYGKITSINFGGNKSDIKDVAQIKKLYGTIKGKLRDYKIRASYLLFADMDYVIHHDAPLATLLSFSVILFFLALQFRSILAVLVVPLSLFSGFVLMFAVAAVSGVSLNLFNMIVIPTIVGIGIDGSIHIFYRWRKDGTEHLGDILMKTGGAVFFSSFTTFIGFFSMVFAHHRGLRSIGVLASIGITTVTFMTVIVFPIVLSSLKRKKTDA